VNFFLCAILSYWLCFLFTKAWLAISRKLSWYQTIREEGPKEHLAKKRDVPTMGGIAIILSVVLATSPVWNQEMWVLLGTFVASGLLGLFDDLPKILHGRNLGLKARHKLLGQLIIGLGLGFVLQKTMGIHQVEIPWVGSWDLGWLFVPFVVLVLTATTNAVNLTDGLDGLAAGTSGIIISFFFIVSVIQNPNPVGSYFSAALLGALMAFLWFNGYPAKVFMGDSGSLALGGALCALAFQSRLVYWLPIAGGVLVAEALSVILQVVYFRATGGKRLFKMSPLHHHFELSGVPESQVTLRFWIVSLFLVWVSIVGAVHGY